MKMRCIGFDIKEKASFEKKSMCNYFLHPIRAN